MYNHPHHTRIYRVEINLDSRRYAISYTSAGSNYACAAN